MFQPHEGTKVQAINDFILFTVAGIGSVASGFIYDGFGKIHTSTTNVFANKNK